MLFNANNSQVKHLKRLLCSCLCISMTALCACNKTNISSNVEVEEIITDMRSQNENTDNSSVNNSSADNSNVNSDINSGNNNPGNVPDQSIGNTDYNNSGSSGNKEPQKTFTPISEADAIANSDKYIKSLASELKMSAGYASILTSAYSNSNNAKLAGLIKKALKGENLVIATIGGSITNGAKASNTFKNYPNRILSWFKKTFPNIEVTLINAGIGATTSAMGAYRIKEDVLAFDPDLIILEFAVNDNGNGDYLTTTYEGLVRNALSYKDSAVICLYLSQRDKGTAQSGEQTVGDHYKLPQISMLEAFGDYTDYGDMFAANDNLHPNDLGHGRIGLLVDLMLAESLKKLSSAESNYTVPAIKYSGASVYGKDDYLLKLKYTDTLSFIRNKSDAVANKVTFKNNNYTLKTKEYKLSNHTFSVINIPKGKILEMEIKDIRGFCIIMNRDTDGDNAKITVTEKDTGKTTTETISSITTFSHLWNTPPLYAASDKKQHTLTVKIESLENNFSIAAFGIND